MPDAPGRLTGERLERLLPVLERLAGARVRLRRTNEAEPPDATARLEPIPEIEGWWLEIGDGRLGKPPTPGAMKWVASVPSVGPPRVCRSAVRSIAALIARRTLTLSRGLTLVLRLM